MTAIVTVVDYGSSNLYSVARAFEHLGAQVQLSGSGADIERARQLVLPGVGAFGEGMRGLRERGLVEPLREYAASGRPLLGICLGMQMLASASEEFGEHAGLDLIPGRVKAISARALDGSPQKIPHIGWAPLEPPHAAAWRGSIFADTPPGTSVYLVHSYALEPADPGHRLADCDYGGHKLCAAVRRGRIYGCQFHPEKSGAAGLAMLERFIGLGSE
jgi:glutamine amidotransferase